MRCANILGLTLLLVNAPAPIAALPVLSSLQPMDIRLLPSQAESRGQSSSDQHAGAPRPNPGASGIYHVGGGVSPPKLVYAPSPEFTDKARRKKVQGTAIVALIVDAEGNPQDVRVVRSLAEDVSKKLRPIAEGLDENAVKVVKQYRFEPAEFQGKPVPVKVNIEVHYRIFPGP